MASSTFRTHAELAKAISNDTPTVHYNLRTLEQLLYTNSLFDAKKIQPALKFVFIAQAPEEEKSECLTQFSKQLKELNSLRRELNATHACFIATEPSSTETTEQRIVGVITDAALLIINPLGGVAPTGFYSAMKKITALFEQTLYLSSFPLQKDAKDLSSAGFICTELARHFSELTANEINTALTNTQNVNKTIFGLSYIDIDISKTTLLPEKTLKKLVILSNRSEDAYNSALSLSYKLHSTFLKQIEGDIFYDESLLTTIITTPDKNYHQDERYTRLMEQIKVTTQPPTMPRRFPKTNYIQKSDKQDVALGPKLVTDNTPIGPKGSSYPLQYTVGATQRSSLKTYESDSTPPRGSAPEQKCFLQ